MYEEEQFINKQYFENYIGESTNTPVQTLGELYLEENKKEIADFSYIRFAQGEVYFHYKDFETAIFKWENISNELAPWAKKNLADAYIELGLLDTAEGIYLSIETDSPILQIEINLHLLSIYVQQGKGTKAVKVINDAVALNPDYPEITEIARNLFEENKDWNQAVRLASEEAVRTGSAQWFAILKSYVDEGYTVEKDPVYFNEVLSSLFSINRKKFETLAVSLWNSYKKTSHYQNWLKNFNTLFCALETSHDDLWEELPRLYQESYFDLINGTRLISEISPMIPEHLTNWLKIAHSSTSLFASSSVMAWNEMFPMTIPSELVKDAEEKILNDQFYPTAKEDSLQLFQAVRKWADENGIETGNIIKWNIEELASQQNHQLLLAGVSENGKSDFINQILGEALMTEPTSAVVAFKYGHETDIYELTDTERTEITSYEQFQEAIGRRRKSHQNETIIEFKLPNEILQVNGLNIIDTPSIHRNNVDKHPINTYIHFADRLLFILDATDPLTDREKDILKQVSIQAPNLPVHFVLNKIESLPSEQVDHVYEKTLTRVHAFFPNAELMAVSLTDEGDERPKQFIEFISATMKQDKLNKDRISKLQYFVGRAIHFLLDKRVEMENNLIESVRWNDEMVSKLKGAINQVHDLEDEKKHSIKEAYEKMKDEMKHEMLEEIPKILQGSSELITEDSDFAKIHLKLNDEMNNRVQDYLEKTVLKKFYTSLQKWIQFSKEEFNQAQFTLSEMSAGFNTMYGEEKIKQECDFKVLNDWCRDADRMTSGIQLEKFNFLLRFTPAQFLLKSAGKLLAVLPKNNTILFTKYKSYLENEDYHESAERIITKFFQQFELFEKSLERDVNLFFRNPLQILDEAVDEAYQQIESSKAELEKMRVQPELYRDPLNLFEVRLRQYEWMAAAGREKETV